MGTAVLVEARRWLVAEAHLGELRVARQALAAFVSGEELDAEAREWLLRVSRQPALKAEWALALLDHFGVARPPLRRFVVRSEKSWSAGRAGWELGRHSIITEARDEAHALAIFEAGYGWHPDFPPVVEEVASLGR